MDTCRRAGRTADWRHGRVRLIAVSTDDTPAGAKRAAWRFRVERPRRGGVMSRSWTTRQCNGRPSTREIEHAKYMYSRTPGNVDPDTDTAGRILREPGEIVVED